MRVGVDIDGVLINSAPMWREAGEKFAKENNIKVNIDETKFSSIHMFGWSLDDDVAFWKMFKEDYFNFSIPSKEALMGLKKLHDLGHEIVLLTARGQDSDLLFGTKDFFEETTKRWVERNNITHDKLIICGQKSKSKICLEENIDVFIDDYTKNVLDISQVLPVICFKRIYNESIKDVKDSNYKIFRTDDWNLICTIIEYRLQK